MSYDAPYHITGFRESQVFFTKFVKNESASPVSTVHAAFCMNRAAGKHKKGPAGPILSERRDGLFGAEEAVAGVAKTRGDIAVLIQFLVIADAEDVNVGMDRFESL